MHYHSVHREYHELRFVVKNFLVVYTPRSLYGSGTLFSGSWKIERNCYDSRRGEGRQGVDRNRLERFE